MPDVLDIESLTPSEYLMMEVLAARHRLGEAWWTFPKDQSPTARKLEARGLVWSKSGVAQGTIRVCLTSTGVRAWKLDQECPNPGSDGPDGPDGPGRPFSELGSTGMLWLINRTALHPRGYAMALHVDLDGDVTGWSIEGDGSEPWAYAESMESAEKERFEALKRLLP